MEAQSLRQRLEAARSEEVGAKGRQLDQVDTAGRPCQEGSDIGPFVLGGSVPDDINDALIGVGRLDFGQKLHGTGPMAGSTARRRAHRSFQGSRQYECPHNHATRGRGLGLRTQNPVGPGA